MGNTSIEEFRDKALSSLYFFDRYVLGFNSTNYNPAIGMEDEPHKELCDFVQDWSSGKKNKLILVPRKCLKTSCVTVGYTLFELANDPSMTIVIDCVQRSLAIKMLGQIRDICEGNEVFKATFGEWKAERGWTDYSLTISHATRGREFNPSVGTYGMDSSRVSYHPKLMTLDDLVDPDTVSSPESLAKAIRHYLELVPMVGEQGRKIVIGTRQDMDDLYSFILENELDDFDVFIRSAINDDGSLYYPEMLSMDFLKRIESKDPYFYACQYMNDPINPSATMFSKDDIEWYEDNKELPVERTNYMTVDPAGHEGSLGDNTAIIYAGVDKTQNIYFYEPDFGRFNLDEIVSAIFTKYLSYKMRKVGIEQNYFRGALASAVKRRGLEWGTKPRIAELKHYGRRERKEDRIGALQPWFADGKIFLKGKKIKISGKEQWIPVGKNMKQLYTQIISYPRAKMSDDLIDAAAMLLEIIKPSGGLDPNNVRVAKPVDRTFGY